MGLYKLNKGMHPLVLKYIAWMRRHSLNIALIMTVFALILFLVFISWLYLTSTHNTAIKQAREAYFQQLNKEQSTDAAKRAWKRLQSKHGYPAGVIYEPGKAPYYINKSGQHCRFVMTLDENKRSAV